MISTRFRECGGVGKFSHGPRPANCMLDGSLYLFWEISSLIRGVIKNVTDFSVLIQFVHYCVSSLKSCQGQEEGVGQRDCPRGAPRSACRVVADCASG